MLRRGSTTLGAALLAALAPVVVVCPAVVGGPFARILLGDLDGRAVFSILLRDVSADPEGVPPRPILEQEGRQHWGVFQLPVRISACL